MRLPRQAVIGGVEYGVCGLLPDEVKLTGLVGESGGGDEDRLALPGYVAFGDKDRRADFGNLDSGKDEYFAGVSTEQFKGEGKPAQRIGVCRLHESKRVLSERIAAGLGKINTFHIQ